MIRFFSVAILVLIVITGCKQAPLGPAVDCMNQNGSSCWIQIGLEQQWVTDVIHTEEGLYAGTRDDGVFRYDPHTLTWESLGLDHAVISSLLFLPGSPGRLLAGIKPEIIGVTPTGTKQTDAAVFASEDQGITWIASDGGFAERNESQFWAYSLASDPNNPQRVYMSSDGPVFRSEDAGRTWELVLGDEASTGGVWLRSVAISPHEEGHLWVAGHTGFLQAILYRSEDHGNSWTHVNPTPDRENAVFMVAADPDIPERVWAGTEEGVLRSEDAGETWSYVLKHKDASLVQSLLFADGHMFATSHRHGEDPILFQSKNAGETWVRVPVPDSLNGLRSMAIDPEGNLIVGTTGSGVWRVDLRIGEI